MGPGFDSMEVKRMRAMVVSHATKLLWDLTEEELLAGSLTLARCPRCGGQGVYQQTVLAYGEEDLQETEQALVCDCRQRPAELWRRANLPNGRFGGLTLADLDWARIEPSEVATAVRDFAEHLEVWLAEGMGLTLTGNVGTGKTHVAVGLVKLACGLGIEARFLTMTELLGAIKATYDRERAAPHRRNGNNTPGEADVLDELAGVSLLALDDLGTENPTPWARDRLYTLVNRRYLAQRPTIVTTNFSLEELADRLGERTVSRLWGASLVVNFRGADYRERTRRETLTRIRAQTAKL
jgi:DNA replication protein DnaC